MKITNSAQEALLNVMKTKALDPKVWCFEIKLLDNGAIGVGFTKESDGSLKMSFGDLVMAIDKKLDTAGIVIDFVEANGKKGLIFRGE